MKVNLLSRLWRPMLYLTIRHRQKDWYDVWLPLIAGAATALAYILLPKSIPLVGDKSLMLHIQELVKILVGFYIAALAAVATFERAGMDHVMEGKPPQIFEVQGETNHPGWHNLTRRRFLSYLFGYLALISLLLYLGTVVAFVLKPWIETIPMNSSTLTGLRGLTAFVVLTVFWNMVITTMVGLFYLADRLHRSGDPLEETSAKRAAEGLPPAEEKKGDNW